MVVKLAGAAELLWLAFSMIRGGGVFRPAKANRHSPGRLYAMGLATCLLNPKIALLYVALLPQFLEPARGSVWAQTIQLGLVQVVVATAVNPLGPCGRPDGTAPLARSHTAERVVRVVTGPLLAWFAVHLGLAQPAAART